MTAEANGHDLVSLYGPEIGPLVESIDSAFARGTLQSTSGELLFRKPDGDEVMLKGWERRIEGIGPRPHIVTSVVNADTGVLPDEIPGEDELP